MFFVPFGERAGELQQHLWKWWYNTATRKALLIPDNDKSPNMVRVMMGCPLRRNPCTLAMAERSKSGSSSNGVGLIRGQTLAQGCSKSGQLVPRLCYIDPENFVWIRASLSQLLCTQTHSNAAVTTAPRYSQSTHGVAVKSQM